MVNQFEVPLFHGIPDLEPVQLLTPSQVCPASQRVVNILLFPSGLRPAYIVPSAQTVPMLGEPVQSPPVFVTDQTDAPEPAMTVA